MTLRVDPGDWGAGRAPPSGEATAASSSRRLPQPSARHISAPQPGRCRIPYRPPGGHRQADASCWYLAWCGCPRTRQRNLRLTSGQSERLSSTPDPVTDADSCDARDRHRETDQIETAREWALHQGRSCRYLVGLSSQSRISGVRQMGATVPRPASARDSAGGSNPANPG